MFSRSSITSCPGTSAVPSRICSGIRNGAALLAVAAFPFAGCGGGSAAHTPPPPPGQAVVITTQPTNQTTPIGDAATFTVAATGTAPLDYQWSENGSEIPGATSASYTTPPVGLPASGSTAIGSFQVTVSNSVNSVPSDTVTLTAGARAPKPGDIRYLPFQQVSLPGLLPSIYGGGSGNLQDSQWSFANSLGTPLFLGNSGDSPMCGWHFGWYALPPPMDNLAMYYQEAFSHVMTAAAYLQSVAAPYLVITSMDIEPQACGATGVAWIETAQGGFDQRLETISPSQLQTQATTDGQASRIVTAASFDGSGNIDLLSYGWTGDTTTVYEAKTYLVLSTQVYTTVTTLAVDGYFISAFGGNDADGYIVVGMRVKGDTLPRPMNINGVLAPNPDSSIYFTPVVLFGDSSANVAAQAWEQ
jgi:hypothetical protein